MRPLTAMDVAALEAAHAHGRLVESNRSDLDQGVVYWQTGERLADRGYLVVVGRSVSATALYEITHRGIQALAALDEAKAAS